MKRLIETIKNLFCRKPLLAAPAVSNCSIPKCECGGDCFVERPAAINFGKWGFEVHILNFNKNIYSKYCIECFMDIQREPMREAYNKGKEDEYMKCCNDNHL